MAGISGVFLCLITRDRLEMCFSGWAMLCECACTAQQSYDVKKVGVISTEQEEVTSFDDFENYCPGNRTTPIMRYPDLFTSMILCSGSYGPLLNTAMVANKMIACL